MRDSYTNRNHCPSHEMWSYERDGRSSGVLLYYYVATEHYIAEQVCFLLVHERATIRQQEGCNTFQ